MPNYLVNFEAIGGRTPAYTEGEVQNTPTGMRVLSTRRVEPLPAIQTTGAAADGERVFGQFREAKAAALRSVDVLTAHLKEERAHIRGIQEKHLSYAEQGEALAPSTGLPGGLAAPPAGTRDGEDSGDD